MHAVEHGAKALVKPLSNAGRLRHHIIIITLLVALLAASDCFDSKGSLSALASTFTGYFEPSTCLLPSG